MLLSVCFPGVKRQIFSCGRLLKSAVFFWTETLYNVRKGIRAGCGIECARICRLTGDASGIMGARDLRPVRLLSLSQAIDSENRRKSWCGVASAHKIAQHQAGISVYWPICRERRLR